MHETTLSPVADGVDSIATVYGRYVPASKRRLDLTYDYEHAQICALRRIADLFEPTRFLDIGANIGVYAVYLAEIATLRCIQAFEPALDTIDVLKDNLRLQADPRLEAVELALSDTDGTARFKVFGDMTGDNALVSTARRARRPAAGEYEVTTRRLDSMVDATGERFVAKIDVEGHELAVVDGARNYLKDNVGVIQIECFAEKVESLVTTMVGFGYRRIAWLHHDHLFTNLPGSDHDELIRSIVFDEVQNSLGELQQLRTMRRGAVRAAQATLDTVRFSRDPILP